MKGIINRLLAYKHSPRSINGGFYVHKLQIINKITDYRAYRKGKILKIMEFLRLITVTR